MSSLSKKSENPAADNLIIISMSKTIKELGLGLKDAQLFFESWRPHRKKNMDEGTFKCLLAEVDELAALAKNLAWKIQLKKVDLFGIEH